MSTADRKIAAARALLAHLATHLPADLCVELWNGELLPMRPGARDDVRLCIRTPDVVRRMVLRPGLGTFFRLYSEGLVDIVGCAPLDATKRWDHMALLALRRNIDKTLVLKNIWPFLWGAATPISVAPDYVKNIASEYGESRNDQEMIRFHYDVSNDFFALFLDKEMMYSCAYYADGVETLEAAQQVKLDAICRKLRLKPGDRMLDIGCGWGGLSCHAARNYGAIVHGVTLSQAQHDYVVAKVNALGLQDKVTVEIRDYRKLEASEQFDKIAQIEMFEHLGIDNHDLHFKHVHRLLRPRGLYIHQATTRLATPDLAKFRTSSPYRDMMAKYIFPGFELDYIGMTVSNLEKHRFEVHDVESMREHYIPTLQTWSDRLYARREEAAKLAGVERTRMWLLYFALTGMGFQRSAISVFQTLASKRRAGPSYLPLDRAGLYK